jgi:nucleotide-binding universal stress UspA family protein
MQPEIKNKKEQKIIVLTTLSPADKDLILNGVKLALIFRKELCLAYPADKKMTEKIPVFKQSLHDYTLPIHQEFPSLKTSILILKKPPAVIPQMLADDYEAILFVASSAQYKKYSKAVTGSPVPFLFVNDQLPLSPFKKIVIPVDLRKENSDSILWGSWFGRFNQSEITVIAANDNGSDAQRQVTRNVIQAKKLFREFRISHKMIKGEKGSFQNSQEALKFARSNRADLFVLTGSSVITPLDRIIGLPERKIIRNTMIPVLLVNPRRENYILCD